MERRGWRWRRACPCSWCRQLNHEVVDRLLVGGSLPTRAGAMMELTFSTALVTPLPIHLRRRECEGDRGQRRVWSVRESNEEVKNIRTTGRPRPPLRDVAFWRTGAEPRFARRDGARELPRPPDAGSRFASGYAEFQPAGFEDRGRVYALGLVAIAELDGLVDAGGGAGRGHGAEHALVGVDVRLDGGVTAGVENLASDNLCDGRRVCFLRYPPGVKGKPEESGTRSFFGTRRKNKTRGDPSQEARPDGGASAGDAGDAPSERVTNAPPRVVYPRRPSELSPGILGPCPSSGHLSIRIL